MWCRERVFCCCAFRGRALVTVLQVLLGWGPLRILSRVCLRLWSGTSSPVGSLRAGVTMRTSVVFICVMGMGGVSLYRGPSLLPGRGILLTVRSRFSFTAGELQGGILCGVQRGGGGRCLRLMMALRCLSWARPFCPRRVLLPPGRCGCLLRLGTTSFLRQRFCLRLREVD